MGYCVVGDAVIAPNQTERQSHYHENQPSITYKSNSADEAYWGYSYTTFENAYAMVDGSYTIFQSSQAGCGLDPSQIKYDCINGACFESDKYKTPGLYRSLEECEVACGTGCSGKCLSNKEWNKIQDLAKKLKQKNCN